MQSCPTFPRYSVSMAERKSPVMAQPRDRSHLVNVVHQWQVDHIRQGLGEANAGKFASKAKVKSVISRLRLKTP
jgi:predicted transcriptional regulator